MNEHIDNWDDLRTALAVARAGSLSGAARLLGTSHPTVYRRINQIEEKVGARLFERSRRGYALTLAGEELVALARRVEDDLTAVERRIAGQDVKPAGTVRVTTTDTLLGEILTPLFAEFRGRHPEIVLEIVVSNDVFSISRRDADVAIRPSSDVAQELVGRMICGIGMAIYGHRDILDLSFDGETIDTLPWIGPDSGLSYLPLARWMRESDLDRCVVYRVNSLLGSLDAVRSGMGIAILPCYLGDSEPDLVRLVPPIDTLASELWLLTHPDLRHVGRIRAFLDFMALALGRYRERFVGVARSG